MKTRLTNGDIVKIIISASQMNLEKERESLKYTKPFEYRIDISFFLERVNKSFNDISYVIAGKTANHMFLEDELLINIQERMKQWGIKKYSILDTNVDNFEGYGKQRIKIESI